VGEDDALDDLVRAHADLQRLTDEITDARERRRRAAQRLIESGRGLAWIAERLGVTRQAVDGFLKYKERKQSG
jgi:DNA-binding transcriptional regulator LsrR (DeoR family)